MARAATGFEPFLSWDEVLTAARNNKHCLWYWGALMTGPQWVSIVKVFKNGNIRVSSGGYQYTFDSGHLRAGTLYRKAK